MQFLLESQQRNRRWILLKQWLLLLARMAAIGVLVLMLSQLVLRNEWMRLLGSGTTHHLVLVDDSYSMTDRWDNTSALGEAKRAVQSIVDQAYQQSSTQLVSLLSFSEAARMSAGSQPEIFARRINDQFRSQLETVLAGWHASQTDVSPADALKAIPRLPLESDGQTLILYVVTDFRARQFAQASEVRELLGDMEQNLAQIHLVRCVQEARPNLAITRLGPETGVRAAGVEMWMNVTVANYGEEPATGVTVQLEQDGDALPGLVLDDIPPREERSHKFRVQFSGTGAHSLVASLRSDAVEVDNQRYFACDLPAARPVLIIDGSSDGLGGRQLSLALAPGGNTRTGWQPHIEPSSFLVDREKLAEQAAVVLLDVPRLSDDEVASLEEFVRAGGGVAFFVGSECDRGFYNERLYRDGKGLFPAPLKLPTQLLDRSGDDLPDVAVTDNPLFHVLAGRRNGLLPLVLINYYYALADDWTPEEDKSLRVLAKLRNGAPLTIEKSVGDGRVVAQFSTLSSGHTPLGQWSNWSVNPVFPVLANELVSYLAMTHSPEDASLVGDDLTVVAEDGKFEPTFRFFLPGDGAQRAEIAIDATPADGFLSATLPHVAVSGIYEAQLQPLSGDTQRHEYAVNVVPAEGDLRIVTAQELSSQLEGVAFQLHEAAHMTTGDQQLAGFQMSTVLLGALVAILLVEQLLAYAASFHIAPLFSRGQGR